jgi:hypothetical protein
VLGPFAGLLVFLYFIFTVFQNQNLRVSLSQWLAFLGYTMLAILIMFLTWPYLWESPIAGFIDVFRFMSDNPTNLSVLFGGQVYRAGELPRRYLPFILATTLTEPVWILFIIGLFTCFWKLFTGYSEKRTNQLITLTLTLGWFLILVTYVLIRKPAMYDGIRHFIFILPPIFIFIGFAFELLMDEKTRFASFAPRLYAGIILLIFLPGIAGILRLHPYEYTYYNSFIGGTENAFRKYETDYWLTCYKHAVDELNGIPDPINLYVHREAYIADYYANNHITVRELRGAANEVKSGDYVLVNSRTNEDLHILKNVSPTIQIRRGSAIFCSIKRVP